MPYSERGYATCHIPIILLTAKDSNDAKVEGYEAGADSYITKPFTHAILESRVNNLLQQRKRLASVILESQTETVLKYGTEGLLHLKLLNLKPWDRPLCCYLHSQLPKKMEKLLKFGFYRFFENR